MVSIEKQMVKAWYSKFSWVLLLYPLSLIFQLMVTIRRYFLCRSHQGKPFSAPVVVVGNISVGGSGKTPLLIKLCLELIGRGLKVAVVSRGYGGRSADYPLQVAEDACASVCGDEPLLIRQSLPLTEAIIVVDPVRKRGVEFALSQLSCDIVLCDDGLQHYRLHRDLEIAVVDGSRGLGNRLCLPAGPLREPVSRLKSVDLVAVNGHQSLDGIPSDAFYTIEPTHFRELSTGKILPLDQWPFSKKVHALAAIGNPQRFANTLVSLGLSPILLGFNDHFTMTASDLSFDDDLPVIITAKDAVKFDTVIIDNVWVLDVEADISSGFVEDILSAVRLN
jgi:tetraacyldisaccharide 4'-kinase